MPFPSITPIFSISAATKVGANPLGSNIFENSKLNLPVTILYPNGLAPTLVATDVEKIGVIDGNGIRKLSLREGLRLFGYPENYSLEIFEKNIANRRKAFDLLGNTVTVPVIYAISKEIAYIYEKSRVPVTS